MYINTVVILLGRIPPKAAATQVTKKAQESMRQKHRHQRTSCANFLDHKECPWKVAICFFHEKAKEWIARFRGMVILVHQSMNIVDWCSHPLDSMRVCFDCLSCVLVS